jgi:hypothetical protein
MKETKTASGTPEARAAMHEMMAAFEAFKGANDARLDEIERKASADTLLEEKVARIDQAVSSAQARLDRVVSEGRRPELGAASPSTVSRSQMQGEETKAAFDGYLKTGASFGLELKAGLSTASNSAGYVVPEQTERAIERRLMAGSPMREIASVRTVGSGVFRKPVSTAGLAAGWVAETAARPETDPATLAGGNAVAVETAAGWEIIQFRTADVIGDGVWKLSGLLRGQQGTEETMTAGAASGAIVVFLGVELERAASPPAERGLPLLWRAAPLGTPPGGAGVSEVVFAPSGLHERPWSPAHLSCVEGVDGGFDLAWLSRSRLDGDRWEGEVRPADPPRFRVTILTAGVVIRTFEVATEAATYAASDAAIDFPEGFEQAEAAVAQWGDGYGWGIESRASVI